MDREELIRLRARAIAAHTRNPATVVTAHFLLKILDALLDDVQERGPTPAAGSSQLTGYVDLFGA